LASSLSILKNKNDNDQAMGCGAEFGNKKLIVVETRQGGGFEVDNDYINLIGSLRPHTKPNEATGRIIEGNLFSGCVNGG
jgi:hypothetical protein